MAKAVSLTPGGFRMNKMHGFKIAALGTVFALAGCLGADQKSEMETAREKRVAFVNETSLSAIEAANIAVGPSNAEIAKSLDQLGCPKLSKLFTDLSTFQGTWEKPLPQSFIEYLSCFGIQGNGTLDDIDIISEKLNNPTELLDCICGSNALSQLLVGKIELFSAQTSAAAQVFTVSDSKTADNYDASGSKAADQYDGSGSKPADTFSNK